MNLLKYMIKNPEIKLNGTQNVQNILIPKYKVFSVDYNKWRYKSVNYDKTKTNECIRFFELKL